MCYASKYPVIMPHDNFPIGIHMLVNPYFLLRIISVNYLLELMKVHREYGQCDAVLLVRTLLMMIALHTKNPKKRQKAQIVLMEYFQSSTLPLDFVTAMLQSVTKERQHLCKMLVEFVEVYLSAPGNDIAFDSLSINHAFEDVKCAYYMYILPYNFTASRPLHELSSMYTDVAMPYLNSNRSCLPYRNVFFHMYNVLQSINKNGMSPEQEHELDTLLEAVKDDCTYLRHFV